MPLPFVYQSFPEMLRLVNAVAPETLRATRAQRWRERAMRIHDDAQSWIMCVKEWKEVEKLAAEVSDPILRSGWQRRTQTYKIQEAGSC